jgi:hypothetical protein
MATLPYDHETHTVDSDSGYAHRDSSRARGDHTTPASQRDRGGVFSLAFLFLGWAVLAGFWAAGLTAFSGIIGSLGHPAAQGPSAGSADAGGIGWLLINFVGGILVLGGAIAFGAWRYANRDRRLDGMTEAATHAEYDLVEAGNGDDVVSRSPEAHRPEERDIYRDMHGQTRVRPE